MHEHFMIVAYDITSNRRRGRLVKVLSGYGVRVNFSVFECRLSPRAIRDLKQKISAIVHRHDSVLFYELCRRCVGKRKILGPEANNAPKDTVRPLVT